MNNIRMAINKVPLSSNYFEAVTMTTLNSILSALVNGGISNYAVNDAFLQNDSDYIRSALYFPVLIEPFFDTITVQSQPFLIGSVSANYDCKYCENVKYVKIINNYSISRKCNNFLDYEPYTKFTLNVPFFEPIDIPCRVAYAGFEAYLSIDFTTGHATLFITEKTTLPSINKWTYATRESQIGVPIPLGSGNGQEQQRNSILQTISLIGAGAGIVAGIASGNALPVTAGIALGTNAIKQTLQNNVDTYSGKGASGNKDFLATDLRIYIGRESVSGATIPDASLVGKPCNTNGVLSTFTGYTRVGSIHFNPKDKDIYNDEINEIVTLLQSGVIL